MIPFTLCLALLQDQAAPQTGEEWLRRMEQTLVRAGTLQVETRVDLRRGEDAPPREYLRMTFQGGAGNRFRLESTLGASRAAAQSADVRCNDATMASRSTRGGTQHVTPPSNVGETLRRAIALVGAGSFGRVLASRPLSTFEGPDPIEDPFRVEFAELLDPEEIDGRGAVVVRFSIVLSGALVGGADQPVNGRVWIDSERYVPLRRAIDLASSAGGMTMEETIERLVLDEELPADAFEIPGDW